MTGESREGAATHVGMSLNLDLEFGRAATLGAGLGYQQVKLPARMGQQAHTFSAAPTHYWMSALLDVPHSNTVRPRANVGVMFASDSDGNLIQPYLALGASFHAPGLALHVTGGPMVSYLSDETIRRHRGTGAILRVRLVKLFSRSCDQPANPYGGANDAGYEWGESNSMELCRGL